MSFVDAFSAQIVKLEASSREYRVLPEPGGLLDQKEWIMDAYAAVRIARDDYYLWKMKRSQGSRKARK